MNWVLGFELAFLFVCAVVFLLILRKRRIDMQQEAWFYRAEREALSKQSIEFCKRYGFPYTYTVTEVTNNSRCQ